MTLPFDRVILGSDEGQREFSLGEFLALPLHNRIKALLSRNLAFFRGGLEVDRRAALESLRTTPTADGR
jgi:hypothetical protein